MVPSKILWTLCVLFAVAETTPIKIFKPKCCKRPKPTMTGGPARNQLTKLGKFRQSQGLPLRPQDFKSSVPLKTITPDGSIKTVNTANDLQKANDKIASTLNRPGINKNHKHHALQF